MRTKYAIVILVGGADEPIRELGLRTPLEVADTPHMDVVSASGRVGIVHTVPETLVADGDVALLTLLGYDARACYTGRAAIEAVARNITLGPQQVIFRCNLICVADDRMADHTAGRIGSAEAAQLVDALNAAPGMTGVRFHAGLSYRCFMVVDDSGTLDAACIPPQDIPDEPIRDYLPRGRGGRRLREIMEWADDVLAGHEVNLVRTDLGESPANAIWPWGQGVTPALKRFRQMYDVRGAAVGAVDLAGGLAKLLGWGWIRPPGATGGPDTDCAAKGRAAVEALDEYDLVLVHVEAPGEAALAGDLRGKMEAIERVDAEIIAPLLDKLGSFEQWRILIAADLPALVERRVHTRGPAPLCMSGTKLPAGPRRGPFNERLAASGDLRIDKGSELMEYFLRV